MRWNPLLLFLILSGCAGEPAAPSQPASQAVAAERSAIPDREGVREVALGCTLAWAGERMELACPDATPVVIPHLVGVPAASADGSRVAWSHAPDDGDRTRIEVVARDGDRWGEPRVLVEGEGRPDRVALDAAGERVAYVAAADGIAALWVVPFAGGEPVQLTNVGLASAPREPGQPPEGFVPVPHRGPPVFDGDRLTWTSPEGEHAVELP